MWWGHHYQLSIRLLDRWQNMYAVCMCNNTVSSRIFNVQDHYFSSNLLCVFKNDCITICVILFHFMILNNITQYKLGYVDIWTKTFAWCLDMWKWCSNLLPAVWTFNHKTVNFRSETQHFCAAVTDMVCILHNLLISSLMICKLFLHSSSYLNHIICHFILIFISRFLLM